MSQPSRYRKRPVEIEAMQFDGSNADAIVQWIDDSTGVDFTPATLYSGDLRISTLEGEMRVSSGDFVIRGVQGEFYPCKPDIFAATYDGVPA